MAWPDKLLVAAFVMAAGAALVCFDRSSALDVETATSHIAGASANIIRSDARGVLTYETHCAACHGPRADGASAPSLIGERTHKNVAEIADWIKDPRPPMPALYPQALTDRDVGDLAAFIGTL
jgi:mono/diheme cytochrome c family protein